MNCTEILHITHGRHAERLDASQLMSRIGGYTDVVIDLGAGDGRYVRYVAAGCPTTFAIGVDACAENLRSCSRDAPPNALYIVANALALPAALNGLATRIAINFPWGSLLAGLLDEESGLPSRLAALAREGAGLEVRLNAGALAEQGMVLDEGGQRVRQALRAAGFDVRPPAPMGIAELRECPTTWARRLAFGRDPRALLLRGQLSASG